LLPEFCTSPPKADKSEAFICKAFKGDVVLLLLRALNNPPEADR